MNVEIKCEWVAKLGAPIECAGCKAEITGRRYNLEVKVHNTLTVTKINICPVCHENQKDA